MAEWAESEESESDEEMAESEESGGESDGDDPVQQPPSGYSNCSGGLGHQHCGMCGNVLGVNNNQYTGRVHMLPTLSGLHVRVRPPMVLPALRWRSQHAKSPALRVRERRRRVRPVSIPAQPGMIAFPRTEAKYAKFPVSD